MRVLALLGLVGIQQAVPGPWPLSVTVCAAAALAGAWAVATLKR